LLSTTSLLMAFILGFYFRFYVQASTNIGVLTVRNGFHGMPLLYLTA
jgi:hypothetical protein